MHWDQMGMGYLAPPRGHLSGGPSSCLAYPKANVESPGHSPFTFLRKEEEMGASSLSALAKVPGLENGRNFRNPGSNRRNLPRIMPSKKSIPKGCILGTSISMTFSNGHGSRCGGRIRAAGQGGVKVGSGTEPQLGSGGGAARQLVWMSVSCL